VRGRGRGQAGSTGASRRAALLNEDNGRDGLTTLCFDPWTGWIWRDHSWVDSSARCSRSSQRQGEDREGVSVRVFFATLDTK